MKIQFLKESIQSLINEISTEDELGKEINQYFKITDELEAKKKEFKEILDYLSVTDKSLKTRFTKIQKYMEEHEIQEKKGDKWIAKLQTVLKNKRVQASFKELWLTALEQFNEAHRKVMIALEEADVEAKRAETKIELELKREGVMDFLKSFWNKIKKLTSIFDSFKKTVDSLPDLEKGLTEETTTASIGGYDSKYFLKKKAAKENKNPTTKIIEARFKKLIFE